MLLTKLNEKEYKIDFEDIDIEKFSIKKNKFLESKKILPRPLIRDKNGKIILDYTYRDWLLKLNEKIVDISQSVMEESDYETAEELTKLITLCVSWLEYLEFDEEGRFQLFKDINKKNEKKGCFIKE